MDHPPGHQPLTFDQRPREDPLVGWRYWQLVPGAAVLRSVSQRRFQWVPGQALRASCVAGGHASPAERCNCGIYAAPDLDTLRARSMCLAPEAVVVGQVALWGTVASDDTGHRGEYAYPKMLLVVEETVPDTSISAVMDGLAAYGVSVGTTSLHQAVGDVSAATMAFQAMSLRTAARPD